jgi:hypothetical protein
MKKYSGIFFISVLIGVVFAFVQCKKNNSTLESNDPNTLWDKDITTIQKAITGKWQWYSFMGGNGQPYATNQFVDITEDKWVATTEGSVVYTFTYSWKRLNTPSGYTTYVMWNNEQHTGWYYFESIKNDTLSLLSYTPLYSDPMYIKYVLVKVK